MRIISLTKIITGALLIVGIFCGLFVFFKNNTPKKLPSNKIPLQSVKFETNGYITKKFLIKALAIKKDALFSEINIFDLKNRLLNISQIKEVYIERQFPASIFIKIKEYSPLLKFITHNGDKLELLFIDRDDGNIFRGSCLPKKTILSTPYVELNLEKSVNSKTGYKAISGIKHIEHLINLLQKEYPDIYKDINKFSLLKYDPRKGATWSRIEIYQKSGRVIIFNPNNLEIQLLNLDYMLNEQQLLHNSIKKIDLSSIESAIIETK